MSKPNPFIEKCVGTLSKDGKSYKYFDLGKLGERYAALPYSIRVLLESAVRNCDEFNVLSKDVETILDWSRSQNSNAEIPYKPARVLLQDFTGVPVLVDFAAMRDAVKELGGRPDLVNPTCPVDLVIDHSVQVDHFGSSDALKKNQEIEFQRNLERFQFLKWGSKALKNMLIVPPGSGICHQVNLEYLARVVFAEENGYLYPDSVVGTDSHTTMICGLGVLGWGVGGIEAEAVMLGQSISMVLPQVIGCRLTGTLSPLTTSTDLVLTVTKKLRELGVVGKFVEFFGPGVASLSIADRATLANMCPEYGATVGFFPVDEQTINYLKQTGRDENQIALVEEYLKANQLFRDYTNCKQDPAFTQTLDVDLGSIVPSVSGPKRPHDQVPVAQLKQEFLSGLSAKVSFKGFGIPNDQVCKEVNFTYGGEQYVLRHGSVVIAAITSCTNTSNPSVMLSAALLCKRAVEAGLLIKPYIKTSLSPGSSVVTKYLEVSGLIPFLEKLGFHLTGYGCMTCIGNSGPLPESVADVIEKNDLVSAAVLSGNRNFEGRVHPLTRANYLASPPLVVAYALAGRIDIDFEKEPIGVGTGGKQIFLSDIWPEKAEVSALQTKCIIPSMFRDVYGRIQSGNEAWNALETSTEQLYPWDLKSTYIKRPPFFEGMTTNLPNVASIKEAYALLNLGDSVTTDHISPAGSISRNSPAARYLGEKGVTPPDFNSYGARRGNDEIIARATFANIRLVNKFIGKAGPRTLHIKSGDVMDVYDAAVRYKEEGSQLIVLAGKEYGSGSSRDTAAKGPYLQGVKAVIAESFERIHRSNLVGMGIVPLEFSPPGTTAESTTAESTTAESLGLTGKEQFTIQIPQDLKPRQTLMVKTSTGITFEVTCRFDTAVELNYFRNGGILQYMVRQICQRGS